MNRPTRYTRLTVALVLSCAIVATISSSDTNMVSYLWNQGTGQLNLLLSRVPVEDLQKSPELSSQEQKQLTLIAEVMAFSHTMGLTNNGSYQSVSTSIKHPITNLSVAPALSLSPVRWKFPIVGAVPYLGFFSQSEALHFQAPLEQRGFDTHLRPAGAYSTLGWFKDPIMPHMLRWPEDRLVETLLHELTHATLWVPGSVSFNESFASFVGKTASLKFFEEKYGPQSREVKNIREKREDAATIRKIMKTVADDLRNTYTDQQLSDVQKFERKSTIIATIPIRLAREELHNKSRVVAIYQKLGWNNASLSQFGTYNNSMDLFDHIFEQSDSDMTVFIDLISEVTKDSNTPWQTLKERQ